MPTIKEHLTVTSPPYDNLRTLTLEQAKAEANPESWTAKILASGLLEKFGVAKMPENTNLEMME